MEVESHETLKLIKLNISNHKFSSSKKDFFI